MLPFELSTDSVERGYALREEGEDDLSFVQALYASTREEELAQVVQWTPEQKNAFVAQQFAAQRLHYRTQIPDCHFAIVERHGHPVGRLYLEERATQWHLVDIALMPGTRGQGFGTMLLTTLIGAARLSGKGVGIFVEKYNPALRLYQRLGFVPIRETDVYWEMEHVAVVEGA